MPLRPKRVVPSDSREPLVCCEFASLKRCLGVLISEKFRHRGLDAEMADCEYETITVNTASYGGPKPLSEVENERVAMTEKIVFDIDKVVEELVEHRDRLLSSVSKRSVPRKKKRPPKGERSVKKKKVAWRR